MFPSLLVVIAAHAKASAIRRTTGHGSGLCREETVGVDWPQKEKAQPPMGLGKLILTTSVLPISAGCLEHC